jgi:ADP-ribose pyrophosphatase YjhB (NUDIX family)
MQIERSNLILATRYLPQFGHQALVGHKNRGPFAGMDTFPGGKVQWIGDDETGHYEDRYAAGQRELREETGIEVPLSALRLAGRIRLYGDRFGFVDILHTTQAKKEPVSTDEITLKWRNIDRKFYTNMPDDTKEWLPLVFGKHSFRINAVWKDERLCMLGNAHPDTPTDILHYFEHAIKAV